MATRTWPNKNHGRIPEVDQFNTRGKDYPGHRWVVGTNMFGNLTQAREFVVTDRKMQTKIPSADVHYTPGVGWQNKITPNPDQLKLPLVNTPTSQRSAITITSGNTKIDGEFTVEEVIKLLAAIPKT